MPMDMASMGDVDQAMSQGGDAEAEALLKAIKAGDAGMLKSIIKGMVMDCMDEPEGDMAAGSGPSDMEY